MPIPPHRRGAYARSSRYARRGCGGRGGALRRGVPTRTVKSCGPGAPVLVLTRDDAFASRGEGGNKAGPQGDHEAAVTPSRREGRDVRPNLWYLPPAFF